MAVASFKIRKHVYDPGRRCFAATQEFQTVFLGARLNPRAHASHPLRLAKYASAVAPPPSADWSAKALAAISQMYGNDNAGDCVCADSAKAFGIWSGNDTGTPVVGTTQEVLGEYQRICGPGDNGCDISVVLNDMMTTGFTLGGRKHKIDGWVAIDPSNVTEMKVALLIFGGFRIGFNVPSEWMDTAAPGAVWDTPRSYNFVGGHDVRAVGYTGQGVQFATWGFVVTMTWAALTNSRIVTEGYVELAPEWYARLPAPSGFDAAALQADLAAFKAGTVPDWQPNGPTPPVPPIPPQPPVPPTPPPPPPLVGPTPAQIQADIHADFNQEANTVASWARWARPPAMTALGQCLARVDKTFAHYSGAVPMSQYSLAQFPNLAAGKIPWATIWSYIQKYGPSALAILEQILANGGVVPPLPTPAAESLPFAGKCNVPAGTSHLAAAAAGTITQQIAGVQASVDAIGAYLGVPAVSPVPAHFRASVGDAGPGNVTVTFAWDVAPLTDVIASYTLTTFAPDGTVVSNDSIAAPATGFVKVLPDAPGTFSATLVAVNTTGISPPAGATFQPHVAPPPPPPPPIPSTPTGFVASVAP